MSPTNRLAGETSPYLLQHAGNPVDWRPWGPEALEEAQREDKPILLSVGYAACHWCHVMAHESFEDPEVAAVMNRLFVNIKVDREERPDIDQIYMASLHALGEHGGWPLTMFLTPSGEPFWGGTYFPKTARFGRPGFVEVLQAVAAAYRESPDKIEANRSALLARLAEREAPGAGPDARVIDQAAAQLLSAMDPERGGTRGAPKFPNAGLFEMFWRAFFRTGEPLYRDIVLVTLQEICQGGICDHLGGGFARYSVDERWLVPHFEKMLYDNAQLMRLLTDAWAATGRALFEARVEETVGWLAREMTTPEGAFAASLDADSEGEEGRFYVWTADEIAAVLGEEEARFFGEHYGVTPEGNWEGKVVLNRTGQTDLLDEASEARLAAARETLLAARARRVRPGLDDKVLADWNGLTVAALAHAGDVFGRPEWLDMAERAYRFVKDTMTRDGRLGHSWRAGRLMFPGLASDHAAMIGAALALGQARRDEAFLADALGWCEALERHYASPEGGWYWTADDAEALIVRPSSPADEAVPNANGMMAQNLARLHALTGEARWRERAERLLSAHSAAIVQNVFATASLLNGFDLLLNAAAVVVVAPDPAAARPLVEAALMSGNPNVVLSVLADASALDAAHPAHGKTALEGRPTAYVCRGTTCSLPVTEPEAVRGMVGTSDGR